MIIEENGKFFVKVYDKPSRQTVFLCELVNDVWKTCIFLTKQEAEKAEQDYINFWKD